MPKKGLISPSTRAFIREARQTRGYSLFDLLHGYVYGRWSYFYISMGTGSHPLSKRLAPLLAWISKVIVSSATADGSGSAILFEDTYHGKVVPLAAATQLVTVQQDVPLGDLEKIIPYKLAREIILKNPDHIVVLDCPCRAAREHPCLPLDVCLIVGEPFASFVHEHHPNRSRWITSAAAQDILKAEDERGHVHHAFFKDAMFGRFYAICNCCSCCCGAMQAQRQGTYMLASSGFAAQVDLDICQECGSCEQICQFDAISLSAEARVDLAKCMGCGICVNNCPEGAIRLVRMESAGEPLEIQALIHAYETAGQSSEGTGTRL
ncbi:MAG TPA: 4Fe-4S binding protein [Anaerolineaceae bacterium]